jgi:hypothetical protein
MANAISLPDGRGQLELPETAGGYVSAVVCQGADGSVDWRALPPEGASDAWVTVYLDGNEVVANSWSCWRVRFDLATGIETSRLFTK